MANLLARTMSRARHALVPDKTIDRWVENQTRFWESEYDGARDFDDAIRALDDRAPTVFVFDFDGDRVDVRRKKTSGFDTLYLEKYVSSARCAEMYLELFRELVAGGMRIRAPVVFDVYDLSIYGDDCPVFSFQKRSSARNMLLPDIDFLWHEWYASVHEERPWSRKRPMAIFAGSSTGGGLLTLDDVRLARPQRLRWAREALESPTVDFRICDAVQCDSVGTADALRAQPYFGAFAHWDEQLLYRYLVSVDGNGATCSRVVKALRSGSVLLKSTSDHQLYYFDELRPYEH